MHVSEPISLLPDDERQEARDAHTHKKNHEDGGDINIVIHRFLHGQPAPEDIEQHRVKLPQERSQGTHCMFSYLALTIVHANTTSAGPPDEYNAKHSTQCGKRGDHSHCCTENGQHEDALTTCIANEIKLRRNTSSGCRCNVREDPRTKA